MAQLPATMLFAAIIESCKKEKVKEVPLNGKKVIVVGAGISGLAAAKKLREKGFEVIVLEAGSKAGGRVRSTLVGNVQFDEGASWVFGDNGNPLVSIMEDAGAKTVIENKDIIKVHDMAGKLYPDALLSSTKTEYENAIKVVQNSGVLTQSFQTVFNTLYPGKINDKLWKYFLSSNLEFESGADISRLSSQDYDKPEDYNGNDLLVTNGFIKLIDYLGKGANIKLNTRVTKVGYYDLGVVVNAGAEVFKADYVVVSVPLSVLQRKTIEFDPVLPDQKLLSIDSLKMGVINKFMLQWTKPFWDISANYIDITPDVKGKFNHFLNLHKFIPNSNSLMTFALGQYAIDSESLTDAQVQSEIIGHLKAIYGSSVPNPTLFARTKWSIEPDILGAYSYIPVGARTSAPLNISRALANRLFFAGEHTDNKRWGTAHAAYSSGIREANKINALL
jgi:monoamine oxidase